MCICICVLLCDVAISVTLVLQSCCREVASYLHCINCSLAGVYVLSLYLTNMFVSMWPVIVEYPGHTHFSKC